MNSADRAFDATIATLYERHLVPLIFASYAADLARRVAELTASIRHPRILEIAAGTGAVTRALADRLPATATITATDLQQPMLDRAIARGTSRPVFWRQADAMALPFADASFDVVVCQFAAMFFPDKPRAFAEVRRVLDDGGVFVFSVWDRLETNEFAHTVTEALANRYPDDPPMFMARTPHGYFDHPSIERDLWMGGFPGAPAFETVQDRSRAPSAAEAAFAYCQGTPLRNEIEAREPGGLDGATAAAAQALAERFGDGPIEGRIQAHIVSVAR